MDTDTQLRLAKQEHELQPTKKEVREFCQLLVENIVSDPTNGGAYLSRAVTDIQEYMPQAAMVLGLFEDFINPLRAERKHRKNPVAQKVLPMLAMAKLLKLLEETRLESRG